ncbi:MAG: S9 family peptidase [Chitinophagaceae bacterium]|nr:S9 family peptidase [Oligoflexus sp.]
MSLDPKTLDLLTAKDNLIEAQWVFPDTIIALEARGGDQWGVVALAGELPFLESFPPIGSSLPFAGQLVAAGSSLFAAGSDARIYNLKCSESWESGGPATDLAVDKNGFLTWVGFDAALQVDTLYRRTRAGTEKLLNTDDFMRHVQWHPQRDQCIFLQWPRDHLPWHTAELHVWSSETGTLQRLNPPGLDNHPCGEALFSPSGDTLAATFLTGDFFQVWLYKFRTQNWIQISFEAREHSTPMRRSSRRTLAFGDETSLISASSHKAFWHLEAYNFSGASRIIKSAFTEFSNIQINRQTGDLLTLASALTHPPQVVTFHQDHRVWRQKQIKDRNATRIKPEPMTWATDTGETVHGILYRDPLAKGPSPLIIPVHGGPTDAVHATWPSKALAFVQQGYAVLYVNYRGSWGYGYDYHQSLAGHWGHKEILDCVTAVRSLSESGWIDPGRVGLWGGGTASFTVLWALIRYPETFQAGVAVFPLFDLIHHFHLCSEAERTELLWALGMGSKEDLIVRSPIHAIRRLRRPLCLFSGELDKRVHSEHLLQVSQHMSELHVPLWSTVYPGEARSWRKHSTYIDYYSKVAGFFDRFLRFRGQG